jgi:DNA polymerase-3 subunit alpha
MAQEKEAFGFYFSAHPVDRYRHIAEAKGAKSFGTLCAQPVTDAGGRSHAVMAALVEEVRWRDTRRGGRYVAGTFSDSSGQFQASCFDEDACKQIEAMARDGECGLFTVELDRQPGEETPRVTIRQAQPFSRLAGQTRMELWLDVDDAAAVPAIAALLKGSRGGRSEVGLRVRLPDGAITRLRLGRDFQIDADLAERLASVPGVAGQRFIAAPQLRLVG